MQLIFTEQDRETLEEALLFASSQHKRDAQEYGARGHENLSAASLRKMEECDALLRYIASNALQEILADAASVEVNS